MNFKKINNPYKDISLSKIINRNNYLFEDIITNTLNLIEINHKYDEIRNFNKTLLKTIYYLKEDFINLTKDQIRLEYPEINFSDWNKYPQFIDNEFL